MKGKRGHRNTEISQVGSSSVSRFPQMKVENNKIQNLNSAEMKTGDTLSSHTPTLMRDQSNGQHLWALQDIRIHRVKKTTKQ